MPTRKYSFPTRAEAEAAYTAKCEENFLLLLMLTHEPIKGFTCCDGEYTLQLWYRSAADQHHWVLWYDHPGQSRSLLAMGPNVETDEAAATYRHYRDSAEATSLSDTFYRACDFAAQTRRAMLSASLA